MRTHNEFFDTLTPGQQFYVVRNETAELESYWYVGLNPKSDSSIVAIHTSSVTKAVVIRSSQLDAVLYTTNYEEACEAYIKESEKRAFEIKRLFGPNQK